jgi:hypothetical protein
VDVLDRGELRYRGIAVERSCNITSKVWPLKELALVGRVLVSRGTHILRGKCKEVHSILLNFSDEKSLSDFLCARGHEMIPKGKHHAQSNEYEQEDQ